VIGRFRELTTKKTQNYEDMKQLTKLLLSSAGALLVTQAVHAQTVGDVALPGDLILGFAGNGANNFILDLGQFSAGHTDLSSAVSSSALAVAGYSTFNASVFAGVVGGDVGLDPTTFVFGSRAHNAGAPPNPPSGGGVGNASGIVTGLAIGAVANSAANSWNSTIAVNPTTAGTANPGNYVNVMGGLFNPLQAFGANGILQEDVYKITGGGSLGTWQLLGTLTMNFSNPNSPSVAFDTPAAVPEPSTYGLLAGMGLLLVALRRQVARV
jgi:hypothetical protein